MFTGMSIAVSLFLVTVLYAYINMQDESGRDSPKYAADRGHSQARADLPRAHRASGEGAFSGRGKGRRRRMAWFGGKYKDDKIPFAEFATDPQQIFDVFSDSPCRRIKSASGKRIARAASSAKKSPASAAGTWGTRSCSRGIFIR